MDDANESLEGQVLASQFRILRKLGAGGMGAVYLAEQIDMDRKVVVKVLHPELTAMNPTAIERFRREAKAVAQLNHPNIVQVYVFGQADNGQLYFAMEYIEGRDLAHELAKGPMAQPRALKIMDQIAAALIEAHGAGIVHRDLKPENVMLADRHGNPDYVKVLDFGIAKLHDSGDGGKPALTQAGTVFGTPRYMSPEQVKGETIDARSDIYALGLLLHELLTGRHPFVASTTIDYLMKHVSEPVEPPREAYQELDISPRVESIVMKALEKAPADRYQSAAELQRDVRTALRDFSEAVRGYPSAPPERPVPTPKGTAAATKGTATAGKPGRGQTQTHHAEVVRPRKPGVHPAVWVVLALIIVGGLVGLVVALKPPSAGGGAGPIALAGPTDKPVDKPIDKPTEGTDKPVDKPVDKPTEGGTDKPTEGGTDKPTEGGTDKPTEGPAPTTTLKEIGTIDGFPIPQDTKPQASVSSAEIYDSALGARDVIAFYKAKLHGKYVVKDIPNGIMIENEDSPFSYITTSQGVGGHIMIALTRNTLVAPKEPAGGKPEPAFGVTFPDDAVAIMKSAQAVVMRTKKPFREVCDGFVKDPAYGGHKGVVIAKDPDAQTPYCTIANANQPGSEDLKWQAIAIMHDPMEAGAVMITVAPKTTY